MTDGEILCNFKKCRKVLTGTAYITRCSHAFCEEDGMKEIESQNFDKKCPACRSPLTKNYDLVKVTLNPSDQFKSMVLAGLRPEIIMDIATRAILFWSYQLHQEHLHQDMVSKNLRDIVTQLKADFQVESGTLKADVQALKRRQESLEKELDNQKIRNQDLSEKLAEKSREAQKWQMMCESLQRKQLSSMMLEQEKNNQQNGIAARSLGPQIMEEFVTTQRDPRDFRPTRMESPRQTEAFIFEPRVRHYTSPKIFIGGGEPQYRLPPRRH